MDKEVNRIRINKLYSESNIFDCIEFHDGVNLILGEKYDNNSIKGRKTNGVGKSMCIEFIDFCLLNDYNNSRIKKIPENIVGLEENISLNLEIGKDEITISRNRKEERSPLIIKNGKEVKFNNIDDARIYLKGLMFGNLDGKSVPSFRNMLSILIRDERSEFKDIIKCHDLTKRIPDDFTVHLFLLSIGIERYKQTQKIIKEIETIKKIITKNKKDITDNKKKKVQDVRAKLNSLNDDLKKMELAIESFKSNELFNAMEQDIIDLESELERSRNKQKVIKYELEKINRLPKPEELDDKDIELVYNQFKNDLGSMVVKSLQEVTLFKNRVENFQRMLINEKAEELRKELNLITNQIRILDEEYSEKIKIIDQKGVLKNLKTSLKIYEEKKSEYANISFLINEFDKNTKRKKTLCIEKSQEILKIDELIDQNKIVIDSFLSTLLSIHESIMGNKECSFVIETINSNIRKHFMNFNLRIYDDGSRSVNRTKVFIYDMALLFNEYTRKKHPLFLIHDNIFDVDQDTLVQSLNYLHKQEEQYQDFQYILTLNRDKIEDEEKRKLITLDVDSNKVATFTKENKFLKNDYQEK
ncbi:DUF2326 domain-containing protein [Tissierellaceae bacterium HCP3S3_D8]